MNFFSKVISFVILLAGSLTVVNAQEEGVTIEY